MEKRFWLLGTEAVLQRHQIVTRDLAAGRAHIDAARALNPRYLPSTRHSAPRRRIDKNAGASRELAGRCRVTLMFIARVLKALTGLVSGTLARRTKVGDGAVEGLGTQDP